MEADRIGLKNDKCRDSLLEKYMHMYLYDEGEVRRVIDAVWATTSRPAKYQVVTQFIETINADDLINAYQDNVNYLINAELHQCIKAARDIPNQPCVEIYFYLILSRYYLIYFIYLFIFQNFEKIYLFIYLKKLEIYLDISEYIP
jgi:hypothetical protein